MPATPTWGAQQWIQLKCLAGAHVHAAACQRPQASEGRVHRTVLERAAARRTTSVSCFARCSRSLLAVPCEIRTRLLPALSIPAP
eukprot:5318425-Prymnesium_polylepis.1